MNSLWASEQLGDLKVEGLVLRPQFEFLEPRKAQFALGESLFTLGWEMDHSIRTVFSVGAKTLIGPMAHFVSNKQVSEDLGFIEAYGEYEFNYGRIRAGLQPVQFGLEGDINESNLDLPRSLLFQRRVVALRDIGISYYVDNNHFFTQLMLHNGVGVGNPQGHLWYTAKWGWKDERHWSVGLSGQIGSTNSERTVESEDSLAEVDVHRSAQWRIMGPFMMWDSKRWKITGEGYLGNLIQDQKTKSFSVGHLDVDYSVNAWFFGFRFDHFDGQWSQNGNLESQFSLATGFRSENQTSRIYLVATKSIEEGTQIPNDEIRLVWHLTPLIR
ncbi:MAG: hypothetical protein K1X29_01820 [Bdellovibrionales bacterium]|nr:hypothetical protein [Bdellovibrionales bacterium]